ncbi:hypothetical protein HYH02_001689 [Chlamydomonas schloesseri]|uniref:Cytosolic carboxypeptidase-like protein 5 n=1 Tax=Chlamydomonas schloesseri TaxID=2026947 RepID=A0A835WUE7_9CHLO|nr:hypothetical protein HYH02_001689 [Chlamydomonas schloesseri]|eukprot:KAG2453468.1 hypothetical protein HYH02_001689 [Chlamydomonas schloesseri]
MKMPERMEAKADAVFRVGKYTFRADFDSANLNSVEPGAAPNEFMLRTNRDCGGTANEKATRTWFYFGVHGHAVGELLTMTITNLNKQGRLFSQDYRPWCWFPAQGDWQPLKLKVTYRREGDDFQLRFSHRFETEEEALFAFAIPFSYAQNCELLDHLDTLLQPYTVLPPAYELDPAKDPSTAPQPPGVPTAASRFTPRTPSPAMSASGGSGPVASRRAPAALPARATSYSIASPAAAAARRNSGISSDTGTPVSATATGGSGASFSGGVGSSAPSYTCDEGPSRLYYRRQLLTRSLEGRRIEVITITDCAGTAGAGGGELEPPLPGVFEHDPGPPAAAFNPEHKKVFFVSSRVHPGETPATHMFNGLLAFLLRRTDPRAAALRRRFVFKLVPIVNADGVAVGNYRTDTLGQNLNRFYLGTPDEQTQPAVFAVKALLMHYAQQGLLQYYIDLHAHANKKGVFIYGNTLEDGEAHLQSLMYARLVALNNPVFDFVGCNFTEKNMSRADKDGASKEGAGRVALYRETGLTHLYTIEANYNTSARVNTVAPASGDHAGRASPPCNRRFPPKFTASVLQGVGRAIAVAALDMEGANPWTRLPHSEHRSLEGVRSWITSVLRAASETRAAHLPPMSDAAVEAMRATAAPATSSARSSASGSLARRRSSSMHSADGPPVTAVMGHAFGRTVSMSTSAAGSAISRRPPIPAPTPPLPSRRPPGGVLSTPTAASSGSGTGVFGAGALAGHHGTHAGPGALARSTSLPVRSSTPLASRLHQPHQHQPSSHSQPQVHLAQAQAPQPHVLEHAALALPTQGALGEDAPDGGVREDAIMPGSGAGAGGGTLEWSIAEGGPPRPVEDGPSESDGDSSGDEAGRPGVPPTPVTASSPSGSVFPPPRPGSARLRGMDGVVATGSSLRASLNRSLGSPAGGAGGAVVKEFRIPLMDHRVQPGSSNAAASATAAGQPEGGAAGSPVALDPTLAMRMPYTGGAVSRDMGGGPSRPLSAGAVGRPMSASGARQAGAPAAAAAASGSSTASAAAGSGSGTSGGGNISGTLSGSNATGSNLHRGPIALVPAGRGASASTVVGGTVSGPAAPHNWRVSAALNTRVLGSTVPPGILLDPSAGGGAPANTPKSRSSLSFVRSSSANRKGR